MRNSGHLMVATGVNLVLGFVYWVLAARLYTPHAVGVAAALVAALSLAWAISSLGIGNHVIQILPGRPSGREWSSALNTAVAAAVVLGLLAAGLMVAAGLVLGNTAGVPTGDPRYLVVFLVGVVAAIATDVTDKAFIGERRTERVVIRNFVFSAGKVVLLVLPVFTSAHALGLASSWVIASAASLLVSYWLLRGLGRGYGISARGARMLLRPTLRSSVGHHFVSVGNLAPGYLLPLLVAAALSATQSAYFYTTWRVGGVFFIISAAVATSLFAHASHADADLGQAVRSSVKLITVLLIPAIAVCALAGRPILGILGPEYERHGYALLLLMMLAAIPDAVTNVYVAILRVRRRLHFAAFLTIGMAVAAVVFAKLLVDPYGIAGVGAGWLIGQSLGAAAVGADLLWQRRAALRRATAPLSRAAASGS